MFTCWPLHAPPDWMAVVPVPPPTASSSTFVKYPPISIASGLRPLLADTGVAAAEPPAKSRMPASEPSDMCPAL